MQCLARSSLLAVLAVLAVSTLGCGPRVNYPEVKVTSPLNRPGDCAACKKKIESVTQANLVVIDGVQYVTCDEKCVAELRKQIEWQNGR
jgi:hypothetical protein